MKRKIMTVLAAITAIATIAGCSTNEAEERIAEGTASRFVIVEKNLTWNVLYDRHTKVMYVMGSHGTFTLIVGENGEPLLYEE